MSTRTCSLCAVILLVAQLNTLAATPQEQDARREMMREALAEAGLTRENCRLRATRITGVGSHINPLPYPKSDFPYDWNFDDGTLCGITENGAGMEDLRVEGGMLKFKVTGRYPDSNFFSWGDFNKSKPALNFDRYNQDFLNRLSHLQIRMRQSLPESKWQMTVQNTYRGRRPLSTPWITVKGTDWQTVYLTGGQSGWPPYTGVRISTDSPGNQVEIDWVQPCIRGGRGMYRKTFELPAKVRWAKFSISTGPEFTLFVNGRQVATMPWVMDKQIWNYDIDPALLKPGKNVIALQNQMIVPFVGWTRGALVFDGAVLCEDGSHLRVDSDESWRFKQGLEGTDLPAPPGSAGGQAGWAQPDYDDSDWAASEATSSQPMIDYAPGRSRYWFNPSYKGQIMVAPADLRAPSPGSGAQAGDRSQPVYGSKEDIVLRIAIPKRVGETHEVSYQVFDEMGDGFRARDELVAEGELNIEHRTSNIEHRSGTPLDVGRSSALDDVGVLSFPAGTLPHNRAYALVLKLTTNGDVVETRRYEIAVCGPVEQPIIENPRDYTDGMDLKLVWENDAAAEQKEGEFISCDGDGVKRPSKVIETKLGRFRQTYAEKNIGAKSAHGCNYLSFRYTVEHPGRPHVALAEYPDDTVRVQEMRLIDVPPWSIKTDRQRVMLANHTTVLGLDNPLTREIRRQHVLFFPNQKQGTVTFLSVGRKARGWDPSMAARVGKIRIYEVLNDVPVRRITDAPGPRKWIGQQPEPGPRVILQSCLASPVSGLLRNYLILSDIPNFYRNWMVAYINMVKRMRFAGENAYYCGQYMYFGVLSPSKYSEFTEFHMDYSGDLRDSGVLMAKMFEENDLGLFTSMELWGFNRLRLTHTDKEVAEGFQTLAQVDKDGRQKEAYRARMIPNWIHPDVRTYFDTIINEYIASYGKEPGWKGIAIQPHEVWGPGWVASSSDRYKSSYDDYTVALFEKETGIKVPVDPKDLERFSKRYTWLLANAKEQWIDWRCRKITDIYQWMSRRLKETRPDLRLIITPSYSSHVPSPDRTDEDVRAVLLRNARETGFDIGHFLEDDDITLAYQISGMTDASQWLYGKDGVNRHRYTAHQTDLLSTLSDNGRNGIAVRYGWSEPDAVGPEEWDWQYNDAESWPYPSGEYFADYWVNIFIRSNPALITHPIQDISMWTSRETDMSRFAKAYRSIPAGKYTRLTGNGTDRNVWITTCTHDGTVYGYVANPQWWTVDAKVTFAAAGKAFDLIENKPIRGRDWQLKMAPYSVHTFRLTGVPADQAVVSCEARAPADVSKKTQGLIEQARQRLEANRALLRGAGREEMVAQMVADSEQASGQGDWAVAYELLTSYPYTSLWARKVRHKKPGEYEPRKLVARKRTGEITIDGDLEEWPEQPAGLLTGKKQIFPAATDLKVMWQGEKDLSARVRVQWDEDNVYLAFAVRDDRLYFDPLVMHRGDSVEVYFDTELGKDLGHDRYSDDDNHFKLAPPPAGFAPPAKGKGDLRITRKRGKQSSHPVDPADNVVAAWKKTRGGYQVEARIPWRIMRRDPVRQELEIGFDVMLNDAEGKKRFKQWMLWSSNQTKCYKDPSAFGRLILGDEKGTGPSDVTIKSPHLSYFEAKKLCGEKKYGEALEPIRLAVTQDAWDLADDKDVNLLRDAYRVAFEVTRQTKKPEAFLEMTDTVMDSPNLPMGVKEWVIGQRLDALEQASRDDQAVEEANWLIDTPGVGGYYKAEGHGTLWGHEPDPDKKFEHLAWQQTLRDGTVNYIYERMAANRFRAKKYGEALAYYLRTWSLEIDDRPAFNEAARKVGECLKAMGRDEAALEWLGWLGTKPKDRGPCPILGIASIPAEWQDKWDAIPDTIDPFNPDETLHKARVVYGIGRVAASKPLFEKAAADVRQSNKRKYFQDSLRILERWGKELPESVP